MKVTVFVTTKEDEAGVANIVRTERCDDIKMAKRVIKQFKDGMDGRDKHYNFTYKRGWNHF